MHGSEVCFKKFISSGKFYKADVLILGGDLTGKALIPVIEDPKGTFSAKLLGESLKASKEGELDKLLQRIKAIGYYPYLTTPQRWEEISSKERKVDEVFNELMRSSLTRWIRYAEERLKGSGIQCYIFPGNDDERFVGSILDVSDYVINPDEKIVNISDELEMASLGYSNVTPWRCPRDVPEEELSRKIEKMMVEASPDKKLIFSIHVPPYGTGIDLAPELDEQLRPKLGAGGQVRTIPVGSTAVREAMLKYQPILGLHGHVHEARGFFKLGGTLCLNPGSEYQEGILRGVLIQLSNGKVKDFIFTSS